MCTVCPHLSDNDNSFWGQQQVPVSARNLLQQHEISIFLAHAFKNKAAATVEADYVTWHGSISTRPRLVSLAYLKLFLLHSFEVAVVSLLSHYRIEGGGTTTCGNLNTRTRIYMFVTRIPIGENCDWELLEES